MRMTSKIAAALLVLAVAHAFSGTAGQAAGIGPDAPIVLAQAGDKPGWHPLRPLFRLFGGGKSRAQKRKVERPDSSRSSVRRAAPARAAPVVVVQPKSPDARTILVVGDQLAEGMYKGLDAGFAETPGLKVEKLIHRSEGLVRGAGESWSQDIRSAIEAGGVDLVVVLLGTDDRRRIQTDSARLAFHTPEWEEVYRTYVRDVVSAVRELRKPLIWVGLPPASGPDRRSDFLYLNDIYKSLVEPADAIFVDVWEAFLSEQGKYTSYGADIEGKRTRLRNQDGLTFTWAGYRKLAFFAERPIARILGEGPGLDLVLPQNDPDFLLLTGVSGNEETLAGAEIEPAIPVEGSLQHKLIVEGEALPLVSGRADDYRTRP